ncbi:hypothetical protein KDW54_06870 [Burkholderia ambifaria]|uniref:hypothetical protein n=1 Tax=Burkholderia ambifaria TaxID=152480 RepID=UPI001B9B33B1|nr:hypothetical protein [Burkholderia ambifaria]MBR8182118.1 hypothetical protein [Burkholderia ambifaria]
MKGNLEIGARFGRLTALLPLGGQGAKYICVCDCGETKAISAYGMLNGKATSCGCFREENRGNLRRTHGMRHSREYKAWAEAKQRCHNPKNEKFKWYGARGISVCPEWMDDFAAFFSHIGSCPEGFELDRENNDKGYEPGNVRWVDSRTSALNRRGAVVVIHKGEQMYLLDYCEMKGIKYATAWARLHYRPHLIDCTIEATKRAEARNL